MICQEAGGAKFTISSINVGARTGWCNFIHSILSQLLVDNQLVFVLDTGMNESSLPYFSGSLVSEIYHPNRRATMLVLAASPESWRVHHKRVRELGALISVRHISASANVTGLYMRPKGLADQADSFLRDVFGSSDQGVIIGDFNCRHTSWDLACNAWGNKLKKLLRVNRCWKVVAPTGPTFKQTRGPRHTTHSCIDLAIVQATATATIKETWIPNSISLDHAMIALVVDMPRRLPYADVLDRTRLPRRVPRKMLAWMPDWMLMQLGKSKMLTNENDCWITPDPDMLIQTTTRLLRQKMSRRVAVQTRRSGKPNEDWWTPACQQALVLRNKLRFKAKRSKRGKSEGGRDVAYALEGATGQFNRAVEKAKDDMKSGTLQKAYDAVHHDIVRRVALLAKWKERSPQMVSDGDFIQALADKMGKAARPRNSLQPIEDGPTHELAQTTVVAPWADLLGKSITILPKGRAPGIDGITNELLSALRTAFIPIVSAIMNYMAKTACVPRFMTQIRVVMIPKKDPESTDPTKYRPISLMSHIRKWIEVTILAPISEGRDFHEGIVAYRKGIGTEQAIMLVHQQLQQKVESRVAIALDLKGAFDKVPHDVLLDRLRNFLQGIPTKLLNIVLPIANATHTLHVGDASFDAALGIPQGGVLSPFFWNVYIEPLLPVLNTLNPPTTLCPRPAIIYADDIMILILRRRIHASQPIIDSMVRWLDGCGAKLAPEKCVVLWEERMGRAPEIKLYNENIADRETEKYLGVFFSPHGVDSKSNVEHKAGRVKDRLDFLLRRGIAKMPLRWDLKMRIFKSFLRPIIDYGITVLKARDRRALDNVELRALGRLLSVPGNVVSLTKPNAVRNALVLQDATMRHESKIATLFRIGEENSDTGERFVQDMKGMGFTPRHPLLTKEDLLARRARTLGQRTRCFSQTTPIHDATKGPAPILLYADHKQAKLALNFYQATAMGRWTSPTLFRVQQPGLADELHKLLCQHEREDGSVLVLSELLRKTARWMVVSELNTTGSPNAGRSPSSFNAWIHLEEGARQPARYIRGRKRLRCNQKNDTSDKSTKRARLSDNVSQPTLVQIWGGRNERLTYLAYTQEKYAGTQSSVEISGVVSPRGSSKPSSSAASSTGFPPILVGDGLTAGVLAPSQSSANNPSSILLLTSSTATAAVGPTSPTAERCSLLGMTSSLPSMTTGNTAAQLSAGSDSVSSLEVTFAAAASGSSVTSTNRELHLPDASARSVSQITPSCGKSSTEDTVVARNSPFQPIAADTIPRPATLSLIEVGAVLRLKVCSSSSTERRDLLPLTAVGALDPAEEGDNRSDRQLQKDGDAPDLSVVFSPSDSTSMTLGLKTTRRLRERLRGRLIASVENGVTVDNPILPGTTGVSTEEDASEREPSERTAPGSRPPKRSTVTFPTPGISSNNDDNIEGKRRKLH